VPVATGSSGITPVVRASRRLPSGRIVREYAILAVVAVLLASLIRAFLGLAFYIPSPSMVPTLKINDRVIVSRITYRFRDPRRSDIVVFDNPDFAGAKPNPLLRPFGALFELVGVRQQKDKHYIKRIIGLPGETVEVKDGSVWINDKRLVEPWLPKGVTTEWPEGKKLTVPKNSYWVMGDNRDDSKDSRYFDVSAVSDAGHFIKRSAIVGPAVLRVWPFSRFGHP
jgi:signal peptidase I